MFEPLYIEFGAQHVRGEVSSATEILVTRELTCYSVTKQWAGLLQCSQRFDWTSQRTLQSSLKSTVSLFYTIFGQFVSPSQVMKHRMRGGRWLQRKIEKIQYTCKGIVLAVMNKTAKILSLISRVLVRGYELDTSPRWRRSNTHHTKMLHNIVPSKSSPNISYHWFLTMIYNTQYVRKNTKHCLI
jgi:hypothetical protein